MHILPHVSGNSNCVSLHLSIYIKIVLTLQAQNLNNKLNNGMLNDNCLNCGNKIIRMCKYITIYVLCILYAS